LDITVPGSADHNGAQRSLRRSLLGAALGVLLLIGAIFSIGREYYVQMEDARYWVRHTREVIGSLHKLMNHLLDVETGQRGYLLTSDPKYLEPYTRSLNLVSADVRELHALVADNRRQQERVEALDKVIQQKLSELAQTIALSTQVSREAALSVVRADEGRQLMEQARARIATLVDVEEQLLIVRERALVGVERHVAYLAALGTALGLVLLALALFYTLREVARRRTALKAAMRKREEAQAAATAMTLARDEAIAARDAAVAADVAKGRYLASTAHDLRAPLQVIFTALRAAQHVGAGEARESIESAIRAVRTLEHAFTQFIEARQASAAALSPILAPVNVDSVISEVCMEWLPLAQRSGLRLRCRNAPATVMTDRALLQRILANLLSNAIKYTERGGILVSARTRGATVLVQVWNTGAGIAADKIQAAFREFQRVGDRSKSGVGLGLFISSQMALALGTVLTVQSRPGRGSCFSFTLPLAM